MSKSLSLQKITRQQINRLLRLGAIGPVESRLKALVAARRTMKSSGLWADHDLRQTYDRSVRGVHIGVN